MIQVILLVLELVQENQLKVLDPGQVLEFCLPHNLHEKLQYKEKKKILMQHEIISFIFSIR